MLAFKKGDPAHFFSAYKTLWQLHRKDFTQFHCLDYQWKKIVKGKFSFLQEHFTLEVVAVFQGEEPLLMGTFFRAKEAAKARGISSSVGLLASSQDLPEAAARFLWSELRKAYPSETIIAPMNAHAYLGFTVPVENRASWKTGFLTSAHHARDAVIFSGLKGYRKFFSYETQLEESNLGKIRADLAKLPAHVTTRKFSRWNFRRDLGLLNALVNECFTEHFGFQSLTEQENFEIFSPSLPFLAPDLFLFLEVGGELAGFCFGMLDYNQSLRPQTSDAENLIRLLGPKPKRGRLIHIGIRPKFRGQGLIKAARHQIILNFAARGITEIENSYMDEGNINSLSNVASTGGKPLGTFCLYQVP